MIGERILQRRKELGMTQEELASKLGYKSKSTINKIELGINDISQSKVVKFAEALDCSVGFLMDWEELKIDEIAEKQSKLTEYEKQIEAVLVEIEEMHPTLEEMIQVKNYAEFLIKQRK